MRFLGCVPWLAEMYAQSIDIDGNSLFYVNGEEIYGKNERTKVQKE